MSAPKKTKFQKERDREQTADMYLRGMRQSDIAEKLGVSQQQISRDLKTIQKQWRELTTINLDEAKQKELARIDQVEREYWTEWERSRDERTKTRKEKALVGDGETARGKATIETEERLGDPRYLQGVQWCITKRCEVLGLNAPTKVDSSQTGDVLIRVVYGDED